MMIYIIKEKALNSLREKWTEIDGLLLKSHSSLCSFFFFFNLYFCLQHMNTYKHPIKKGVHRHTLPLTSHSPLLKACFNILSFYKYSL